MVILQKLINLNKINDIAAINITYSAFLIVTIAKSILCRILHGVILHSPEVTPNSIKLKNGKELPCGLVVWSTGIAPR